MSRLGAVGFLVIAGWAFAGIAWAGDLDELRRKADQGDAAAQHNLGNRYVLGWGVGRDDLEALRWYRKAAEQGHAGALFRVGLFHDEGKGVPEDNVAAVGWYRRAAEQGHVGAQFNLGLMYFEGEGVPQDPTAAAEWWHRAARQGNVDAQRNLGVMHAGGLGVDRDPVQAYAWLTVASEGAEGADREVIAEVLEEVAADLTPTQREAAERLAGEWAQTYRGGAEE